MAIVLSSRRIMEIIRLLIFTLLIGNCYLAASGIDVTTDSEPPPGSPKIITEVAYIFDTLSGFDEQQEAITETPNKHQGTEDMETQFGVTNYSANDSRDPLLGNWPVIPQTSQQVGLANKILMTSALVLVMLGMGCKMTVGEIWSCVRRPYGILIGLLSQFGIMPLLGFGLAHLLQLTPPQAIGTMFVACSPGGTLSNIFTYWTKGDVTLSVGMTTASTTLSAGMMPLNLFIYTRSWSNGKAIIPYVEIVLSIILILIPGCIGVLVRWKHEKLANIVIKVTSPITFLCVITSLIIQVITVPSLFISGWKIYLLAVIFPVIGFLLGYILSTLFRLAVSKRRTVAFETGCQNVPLAMSIISLSFPPSLVLFEMLIVPLMFGMSMTIYALTFALCFKIHRRYKNRNLSITKSLEPPSPTTPSDQKPPIADDKVENGIFINEAIDLEEVVPKVSIVRCSPILCDKSTQTVQNQGTQTDGNYPAMSENYYDKPTSSYSKNNNNNNYGSRPWNKRLAREEDSRSEKSDYDNM